MQKIVVQPLDDRLWVAGVSLAKMMPNPNGFRSGRGHNSKALDKGRGESYSPDMQTGGKKIVLGIVIAAFVIGVGIRV